MPGTIAAPELSEAQVLFFRDGRSHLRGPGAADGPAAARAILGAQSQQEGPGLLALSLRTRGRPSQAELRGMVAGERPTLVRTWGQRDTLHFYDPEDWPMVVAARGEWPQSGRRGAMPSEPEIEATRELFARARGPLFRRDLFEIIPRRFVEEVAAHPGVAASGRSPERFAASRLIWRLALAGDICFAEKRGSEQSYVHRRLRFPDLRWSELASAEAATTLARRYLAAHGPATAADLAHFFGSRVSSARIWLERLSKELTEVRCAGRDGLFALRDDLTSLRRKPPAGRSRWPVRLLPMWDTHLMRHADKSWLAPAEEERRLIWRKAGVVAASVVARGRVVGTWAQRSNRTRVRVTVTPLSGWRKSFLPDVRREARELAAFLGVAEAEVDLDS